MKRPFQLVPASSRGVPKWLASSPRTGSLSCPLSVGNACAAADASATLSTWRPRGFCAGSFGCFAAELGAFGHCPSLARVLHLAILGVVNRLPKATLGGVFIDFRAARLTGAAYDVDCRLFTAHELTHDRVDQTLVNEGL